MKNTVADGPLTKLTLLILLSLGACLAGAAQTVVNDDLIVTGTPNKSSYLLGEPVSINFVISNRGSGSRSVPASGVKVGALKVFVSRTKEAGYLEYFGRGWGRLRGIMVTLAPGSSRRLSQAVMLWNGVPNVSHLNAVAARMALEGKIKTAYVFPDAGTYYVKGVAYVDDKETTIESAPIEIVVRQPEGEDLAVWESIKGNRDIAIFIQDGEFDSWEPARVAATAAEIRQILKDHPGSAYSFYLRSGLEKRNPR